MNPAELLPPPETPDVEQAETVLVAVAHDQELERLVGQHEKARRQPAVSRPVPRPGAEPYGYD